MKYNDKLFEYASLVCIQKLNKHVRFNKTWAFPVKLYIHIHCLIHCDTNYLIYFIVLKESTFEVDLSNYWIDNHQRYLLSLNSLALNLLLSFCFQMDLLINPFHLCFPNLFLYFQFIHLTMINLGFLFRCLLMV